MNQLRENNPNWKGGRSKNNYFYTKRSRERYPEKEIARKKVARAIQSGKLVKPQYCQSPRCFETEIFGHHIDYSKPLAVEWYCREHHVEADKELKEKIQHNDFKNRLNTNENKSLTIQEDLFTFN